MTKKKRVLRLIQKYIFLLLGSTLAAAGLEFFLIPNKIIDGGIVGISIISSYLSGIPLGLFTFFLNIPFLIFGYKQIGKSFVISSIFSITCFSFFLSIFHPIPSLTDDILLATVFGGIILGVGVGLIIRFGGSLDGTEIIAIVLNRRTILSVGQIVMFFNIFILSSAGLVFGWDRAMYSILAYFIAYKAIDIIIEGIDEAKAAMIISDYTDEIAESIMARLGRGVTFLEGKGAYEEQQKNIIYSVVTRLEIAKLMAIINDKDENAFVTIHDVSDVMGGKNKKRAIH
ncbi:MAG TPA: YitT family protein [Pseudobacteroides sp.]|uniref:YitT family protein n=1 Tax=Pseudobacteroides sp. TaxID=1968840 RepID=UPI002F91EA2D